MARSYYIEQADTDDAELIASIYRSNPEFSKFQLGTNWVSTDFVLGDMVEMWRAGFRSVLIREGEGTLVGFCDYKRGETVYLSLLVVDGAFQHQGMGAEIYQLLEQEFRREKAGAVIVDVPNRKDNVVVQFWKKQGFIPLETVTMKGNCQTYEAVVMRKVI